MTLRSLLDLGARPQAAACTGECQKSGPLGLLVILLLCVACYFLFKSMSKHLKKVREDFPVDGGAAGSAGAVGASADGAAAGAADGGPVTLAKRAQTVPRRDLDPAGGPAEPPEPPASDVVGPGSQTGADGPTG